jgi:hypothetical protein
MNALLLRQKELIWRTISIPSHPDVVALVEKHVNASGWNSDAFEREYIALEEHLLTTIVLPDDIPTHKELRASSGILLYQQMRLYPLHIVDKGGRTLRSFIPPHSPTSYSGNDTASRINTRLGIVNQAIWNMNQHITYMKERLNDALIQKQIKEQKAAALKAAEEAAAEEREARRRLAAIEWEAGRAAREEAERVAEEAKRLAAEAKEARILAKMEELRNK